MEPALMLNDDCLRKVFEYLPAIDRIRVENVCTHWRAVSMSLWSRFTKLEFYLDTEQDRKDSICIQDIKIFDQVIGRVKNYLTSIKLHTRTCNKNIKYDINHLKVLQILKNCPHIQELVILSGNKLHYSGYKENHCKNKKHKLLYILEPYCKNLVKLAVDLHLFCDSTTEMAQLFQKLNKLESIHFMNYSKIFQRNCLLRFPFASLKEFKMPITLVSNNCLEMLNSMIARCVDLQSVYIVILHRHWESTLEALFLHKNIKHLQLGFSPFYERRRPSARIFDDYFSQLVHLEKLDLSFSCSIDDKLLQIVATNCQKLTILNITFCKGMTDNGIASVSSLKKLRYWIMDCLGSRVVSPEWQKMDCLETLMCMGTTSLTCESLCDLVLNKAPKLKLLDVTNCEQVDNKLIDAALAAVNSRDKNLGLTLGIFATKIQPNQEHEESYRLNIIKEGMIVTRQPIVGRRCYNRRN